MAPLITLLVVFALAAAAVRRHGDRRLTGRIALAAMFVLAGCSHFTDTVVLATMAIAWDESGPTPAECVAFRAVAGLSPRSPEAPRRGMAGSLYARFDIEPTAPATSE